MLHQAFFTCYSRGQSVSSSRPQTLDTDDLRRLLLYCLLEEDDFMGVLDAEGVVLEFIRTGAGEVMVELPDLEAHGSLQRCLSLEEALEFLERLPADLTRLDPSGFEWRAWPVPDAGQAP